MTTERGRGNELKIGIISISRKFSKSVVSQPRVNNEFTHLQRYEITTRHSMIGVRQARLVVSSPFREGYGRGLQKSDVAAVSCARVDRSWDSTNRTFISRGDSPDARARPPQHVFHRFIAFCTRGEKQNK